MVDAKDELASPERPTRSGFRPMLVRGLKSFVLVCGLVLGGMLFLGVLAQMLFPGHGVPIHIACQNNLRLIAFALQSYQRDHGCLPPAIVTDGQGKPMHSWRVLILPYLDQSTLYNSYNFQEPWDGPSNRQLIEGMPRCYVCPKGSQSRFAKFQTSYFAIVGPGLIFPGPDQSASLDAIPDGAAGTFLVVESQSLPVVWTEPRDLDLSRMSLRVNDPDLPSISGQHTEGASLAYANGHVSSLPETTPTQAIRAGLTIDGGETIPESD